MEPYRSENNVRYSILISITLIAVHGIMILIVVSAHVVVGESLAESDAAVKVREGFSSSERKKMTLSQDTLEGLRMTGTCTCIYMYLHACALRINVHVHEPNDIMYAYNIMHTTILHSTVY